MKLSLATTDLLARLRGITLLAACAAFVTATPAL